VDLVQLHLDGARLALRHRNLDRGARSGLHADERGLELRREPSAAELDCVVATRVVGHNQVEHEDVTNLRGTVVDGRKVRRRLLKLVHRLLDELVRDFRLGCGHLERAPVRQVGLRLHGNGRGELPRLVVRRKFVPVLRLVDRTNARLRGRVPEPAADVTLDRLRVDAIAPDPLHEHRQRNLALAKAGDLHALR